LAHPDLVRSLTLAEPALAELLAERRARAAILDVFDNERSA
jgi:phosphoglycerate dehydrogenase-like enzyme